MAIADKSYACFEIRVSSIWSQTSILD